MNKIFIFKIFLIAVYLYFALFFFYDDHFPIYTGTLYNYSNTIFMVATICFGIIISATIYNLALYIYLRNIQYLYYALAQTSALFFLITIDSLYITPFDSIFPIKDPFYLDLAQMLMLLFSLLFLKNFFTQYKIKSINKTFNFLFSLIFFDFIFLFLFSHTIIFKFIPQFIPILFVLTESMQHIIKKDIAFHLIIFGWGIVLLTVISQYLGLLKFLSSTFPFFHVAIALESIILSLAIAYKFKLQETERREQQAILLQQSRLASMGEMVSSIAHQWRQPLTILSLGLMNIKKYPKKEEENLIIIKKLNHQLQYMSSTIEDFRDFYNPSKVKNDFDIYESCLHCQTIIGSFLEEHNIELKITVEKNFKLYGQKNEFEQVVLSIINNARDAFIERAIKKPIIHILIERDVVRISDNAGGIEKKYIREIFKPYFSTKKDSDGIGLHIAKLIIEKELNGNLGVKVLNKKTTFMLDFRT